MMLYGVRFLLNLFEMLIYRRFLEAYIGNRRTGLELSVLIMGICAGISSFVNSLGNPVCNLLNTVMILCCSAYSTGQQVVPGFLPY